MRAVVLGCHQYEQREVFPELPSAVASAGAFSALLALGERSFISDPTDSRLLIDPTKRQALDALEWLFDDPGNGVLMFSGHGIRPDDTRRDRALAFTDARHLDLEGGRLWLTELAHMTRRAKNHHVLVVLDCCFAGGVIELFERDQSWKAWKTYVSVLGASHRNEVATTAARSGVRGTYTPFMGVILDELANHSCERDHDLLTAADLERALDQRKEELSSSAFYRPAPGEEPFPLRIAACRSTAFAGEECTEFSDSPEPKEYTSEAAMAVANEVKDSFAAERLTLPRLVRAYCSSPIRLARWNRLPRKVVSVETEVVFFLREETIEVQASESVVITTLEALEALPLYRSREELVRLARSGVVGTRCAVRASWRAYRCSACAGRTRIDYVCQGCAGLGRLVNESYPCSCLQPFARREFNESFMSSYGGLSDVEPMNADLVGSRLLSTEQPTDFVRIAPSEVPVATPTELYPRRDSRANPNCVKCRGSGSVDVSSSVCPNCAESKWLSSPCEKCGSAGVLAVAAFASVQWKRLSQTPLRRDVVDHGGKRIRLLNDGSVQVDGLPSRARAKVLDIIPGIDVIAAGIRNVTYQTALGNERKVLVVGTGLRVDVVKDDAYSDDDKWAVISWCVGAVIVLLVLLF